MSRTDPLLVVALVGACGRVGFDPMVEAGVAGACAGHTFSTPPMSSFVDRFSGTKVGSQWLIPGGTTCVSEAGGSLIASPPSNGGTTYCLVFAQGGWHLTCDSLTMEVAQTTTTTTLGVQTVLYLDASDNTRVLNVILEGGGLQWNVGGVSIGFGNYDPTAYRWWRLRELDGELYFDVAPDGSTFTNIASAPDPASLDDIHPVIGAGTYKNVATPGVAKFRCFNAGPSCQ